MYIAQSEIFFILVHQLLFNREKFCLSSLTKTAFVTNELVFTYSKFLQTSYIFAKPKLNLKQDTSVFCIKLDPVSETWNITLGSGFALCKTYTVF